MNLALTESIFRHSKSLIVHAFVKLSAGNRYFWQVSVNPPYLRGFPAVGDGSHRDRLLRTRRLMIRRETRQGAIRQSAHRNHPRRRARMRPATALHKKTGTTQPREQL